MSKKYSIFMKSFLLSVCLLFIIPLPLTSAPIDNGSAEILSKFGTAMSKVVESVRSSVVNISTSRTIKTHRNPILDDPFFKRFFGEIPQSQQKRKITNLGSGVLATSDGYIITNNHVIEGADDILVKLSNGREYKGKVIGMDSRTDIAVIKINETNLPVAQWGDSEKLRIGELVIAIGNPYGLNQTITMGIISALGRSGIGITDYEDFIQTDAAINPGNSGGALVNINGEVIGINTAIFSTSGGYQGIGFAIPSKMVKTVMNSIINQGKVVRGWLGVQIQQLTSELAKQFNLKDEYGVLLVDVIEGSPAEKSGLKRGDVIVEFDGKKIENPFQLRNIVADTIPGKEVQAKIIRNGTQLTAKIIVEEIPAETKITPVMPAVFDNNMRGVSVINLTDDIVKQLGITKKVKGVIVNAIAEDSPAASFIMKGDIIIEINRKPITNIKEYNDIVSKIEKNQLVLLLIIRGDSSQYITVGEK